MEKRKAPMHLLASPLQADLCMSPTAPLSPPQPSAWRSAWVPCHPPTECACMCAQAAQVRKSSYIGDQDLPYHPDAYHECTVFAGTIVRQVLRRLPSYEALFPLTFCCSGRLLSCSTNQQDVGVHVCCVAVTV